MIRQAEASDLLTLVANAGLLSRVEFDGMGCDTLADAYLRFLGMMNAGEAEALLIEGQIECIMGLIEDGNDPDILYTWFVATDEFYKKRKGMVRLGRQYVKSVAERHKGKNIRTISKSPHPSVGKWFKLCGLREIGPGQYEFPTV